MVNAFWFSILLVLASCSTKSENQSPAAAPLGPEKLNMGAVSNLGIFDPALIFDSTSHLLWMSYSVVDTSSQLESTQRVVSTRIASSNDGGLTWTDQGITLAGVDNVSVSFPGLPTQGVWQNEVSKVLYDLNSVNANDRWKLLTHHYLQVKTTDSSADRRFEHGWISYKKASTPLLLASATEVKLFGAAAYNAANDTMGGTTGSPVAGGPIIQLHTLHSDLNACLIFTEPGLLSTPTHLFMSLVCVEAANYRIALFSCPQPCAMISGWTYIKTLFQNSDAISLGYLNFSASDLFSYQSDHYIMISPEGTTGSPGIYHGCLVYRFSDISNGTLASTTSIESINGTANSFNGACSFSEHATNGFYYSEANNSALDVFRIFKSNQTF